MVVVAYGDSRSSRVYSFLHDQGGGWIQTLNRDFTPRSLTSLAVSEDGATFIVAGYDSGNAAQGSVSVFHALQL